MSYDYYRFKNLSSLNWHLELFLHNRCHLYGIKYAKLLEKQQGMSAKYIDVNIPSKQESSWPTYSLHSFVWKIPFFFLIIKPDVHSCPMACYIMCKIFTVHTYISSNKCIFHVNIIEYYHLILSHSQCRI